MASTFVPCLHECEPCRAPIPTNLGSTERSEHANGRCKLYRVAAVSSLFTTVNLCQVATLYKRRYRSQHKPTHKWVNLTHMEHEHRPGERP